MPADSITFQNLVLDATFRSDLAPADLVLRLWLEGDAPNGLSPVEADFGGYTPTTVLKADWAAAAGSQIATTDLVDLGTPSSDASDSIAWWSLHDSGTDELLYHAPLETPRFVTASASPVRIRPTVPYGFNN